MRWQVCSDVILVNVYVCGAMPPIQNSYKVFGAHATNFI